MEKATSYPRPAECPQAATASGNHAQENAGLKTR